LLKAELGILENLKVDFFLDKGFPGFSLIETIKFDYKQKRKLNLQLVVLVFYTKHDHGRRESRDTVCDKGSWIRAKSPQNIATLQETRAWKARRRWRFCLGPGALFPRAVTTRFVWEYLRVASGDPVLLAFQLIFSSVVRG
jgi:hypothetical protein